ncbi:hypothetical protein CcCBS67573_g09759 [Chytriomyces confervae]|uniref:Uncharacterized protein n=1 Tax=Chytriomyces confervae TaxID=246404 RepID=A0A507DNI2_9FUNG|nr:hypothetical protein CcCBS67573_g09759 [Chytriomyces confervae]
MQATMPPAGANTATLSMILSTLEKMQVAMTPAEANAAALSSASQTVKKMQVTMAAMQQEVADLKETQLSILIGQPDLLTKTSHSTLLREFPGPTVLQYQRLSKAINQCLMTSQFAILNMQTAHFDHHFCGIYQDVWLLLPPPYQIAYAREMLKDQDFYRYSGSAEGKPIPESIICLTAAQDISPIPTVLSTGTDLELSVEHNCFCIIPATIGQLQCLYCLNIGGNHLACTIPPEIWSLTELIELKMSGCKMFGSISGVGNLRILEYLDASNNQFSGELLSREIHGLESLLELHLSRNQFSGGEILDMAGSKLKEMCVDPNLQMNYVIRRDRFCDSRHKEVLDRDNSQESDSKYEEIE